MRNYELTFLYDWIYNYVPMKAFDTMLVREVSMKGEIIELVNDNIAVITKIID